MKKIDAALVYPHQLFASHPALARDRPVFLIEDQRFFSAFQFHKQKLVLHRASMRAYARRLARRYDLTYVPHEESDRELLSTRLGRAGVTTLHTASLCDRALEEDVGRIAQGLNATWQEYPSPMFITQDDRMGRWAQDRQHFHMASFYQAQRRDLDVLMENGKPLGGKWSFDTENRKRLPKNLVVPPHAPIRRDVRVKEAVDYVNRHFAKHPGRAEDFRYPVTHAEAESWFTHFLETRLRYFGPYEDAISQEHAFLFHSVLTPMLNVGLLTPQQVLDRTLEFSRHNQVPLASLEGFLRQVIGWREFMYCVYSSVGETQRGGNFWGCQRDLPDSFYSADVGIPPVDTVIRRVMDLAYCHHIERLMVLGNFMLLLEIRPEQVYQWFMELFVDAYDWVMVPNVFGMSQYADGGLITTKPYISSSNYIRRMSDFSRGPWCAIWDGLFWRFVSRHREVFANNARMRMMAVQWDRMEAERQSQHLQTAEAFLRRLFD